MFGAFNPGESYPGEHPNFIVQIVRKLLLLLGVGR